ncbi:monovalent cation/proton antiporter, MnhG/PhaG subunit [Ahrensia sp. R2A130]|nr:monovalent cation/proton antiporter, MnhG/PhaG subunit [Ahrensia sp. R2A130]
MAMLEIAVEIISWICFITGGFFLFIGSLGLLRLGDFWARLHAASIIDSAGLGLILFGMMFQAGLTLVTVKLIAIVLFLLITGPTASHAVANAAFASGSRPRSLVVDETARKEPKLRAGEPVSKRKRKAPSEKPATKKTKSKAT